MRRDEAFTFSRFHSITGLVDSAMKGCHFCNLVVDQMRLDETHARNPMKIEEAQDGPAMEPLKAEICYYRNKGFMFILRRGDASERDVLASADLFENALGTWAALCALLFMTYLTDTVFMDP